MLTSLSDVLIVLGYRAICGFMTDGLLETLYGFSKAFTQLRELVCTKEN